MKSLKMNRSGLGLSLLAAIGLVFALQLEANSIENQVLVELFKSYGSLERLYVSGPLLVEKPLKQRLGRDLYEINAGRAGFEICSSTTKKVLCRIEGNELRMASAGQFLKAGPRADKMRFYRGILIFQNRSKTLLCSNRLKMKDYLVSVLGSESLKGFPLEALKAQSILVQTSMQRYKLGDPLNDSTEKQAYLGAAYESPILRQALEQTWGKRVLCGGTLLPVYFHGACAGSTSTSQIFTGKKSNCSCDQAVKCNYCRDSPFWKECRRSIRKGEFLKEFPLGLPQVIEKDGAGRALLIGYKNSALKESAYMFWLKLGSKFGWDKMPGTRFSIEERPGDKLELISTGAGHGVGLCQWGACGMAKKGFSHTEILKYYFPGAVLKN